MRRKFSSAAAISSLALLAACANSEQTARYAAPEAGFSAVSQRTRQASGAETIWAQSGSEARAASERVHKLVHQRTVTVDTAVQVALLNNKGLQAAYADLGMSAAEAWQQSTLVNPRVAIGTAGIGADGIGVRTVEGLLIANVVALATRGRRIRLADAEFRQAQLVAAEETLRVASDTRRAWIDAVSAREAAGLVQEAQSAAEAASELAERLGETGALSKANQAREHVFYAEMTGNLARRRLDEALAKENLARLMGLWGETVDFHVPDRLPEIPQRLTHRSTIEAHALRNRGDIQLARLELEVTAQRYGLSEATRYASDLEIVGGIERETEVEDGEKRTQNTGVAVVEFELPIFDTGKPERRKAELAYKQAADRLAASAVNARSEARAAHLAYTGSYEIARHYRNAVVPLRKAIEEQSLLSYGGMITDTFQLLEDTGARLDASLLAAEGKRDFWIADAGLSAAIYGGGSRLEIADGGGTAEPKGGSEGH